MGLHNAFNGVGGKEVQSKQGLMWNALRLWGRPGNGLSVSKGVYKKEGDRTL